MGPVETTGIIIVTVAIIQGMFKFAEHLINKYNKGEENIITNKNVLEAVQTSSCGLNEQQAAQLKALYDLHNVKDSDGAPIWYVPRSWADTQKEIVNELRGISETQLKTLSIIERLEKRIDS